MDPVIISIQSEPWMDSFILAEGTNGIRRRFMEWFKMELVGDTPPTKFENKILDHIKTLCDKFDTPPAKFENKILDQIKTLCDKFDTLTTHMNPVTACACDSLSMPQPSIGSVTESDIAIVATAAAAAATESVTRVPRTYLYSADGVPTDPEELARGEAAVATIIHAANPMPVVATATATATTTCRIPPKPKAVVKKKKKPIIKCIECGEEFDDGRKLNCHKRNKQCKGNALVIVSPCD